jgi:hypothetical protein
MTVYCIMGLPRQVSYKPAYSQQHRRRPDVRRMPRGFASLALEITNTIRLDANPTLSNYESYPLLYDHGAMRLTPTVLRSVKLGDYIHSTLYQQQEMGQQKPGQQWTSWQQPVFREGDCVGSYGMECILWEPAGRSGITVLRVGEGETSFTSTKCAWHGISPHSLASSIPLVVP